MALSGFMVAAECLHTATRVGRLPSRFYNTAEELKDRRYNHEHALEVLQRLALLLASPRPAVVVHMSEDTPCTVRSEHAVCKVFLLFKESCIFAFLHFNLKPIVNLCEQVHLRRMIDVVHAKYTLLHDVPTSVVMAVSSHGSGAQR